MPSGPNQAKAKVITKNCIWNELLPSCLVGLDQPVACFCLHNCFSHEALMYHGLGLLGLARAGQDQLTRPGQAMEHWIFVFF